MNIHIYPQHSMDSLPADINKIIYGYLNCVRCEILPTKNSSPLCEPCSAKEQLFTIIKNCGSNRAILFHMNNNKTAYRLLKPTNKVVRIRYWISSILYKKTGNQMIIYVINVNWPQTRFHGEKYCYLHWSEYLSHIAFVLICLVCIFLNITIWLDCVYQTSEQCLTVDIIHVLYCIWR